MICRPHVSTGMTKVHQSEVLRLHYFTFWLDDRVTNCRKATRAMRTYRPSAESDPLRSVATNRCAKGCVAAEMKIRRLKPTLQAKARATIALHHLAGPWHSLLGLTGVWFRPISSKASQS